MILHTKHRCIKFLKCDLIDPSVGLQETIIIVHIPNYVKNKITISMPSNVCFFSFLKILFYTTILKFKGEILNNLELL